jgi:Uma2 family endonuclease
MGMGVQTLVSEKEYVETTYRPDCDFEDGVLLERNLGTVDHAGLMAAVGAYFVRRRRQWNIHVYASVRMKVRAGKYMIPDLSIVQGAEPAGKFLQTPPLLLIEILSPEDRPIRVNERVREELRFGVPFVWVIDPETMESELHTQSGSHKIEDGVLRLAGTPIEVHLSELDE